MTRFHHHQAWALIALGLWLLFSPFLVPGYQAGSLAVKSSDIFGMLAFLIGCAGLVNAHRIDETINMALSLEPRPSPRER